MEKQKLVTIYTESSPNPNSQKFVFNFQLIDNMSFDYQGKEGAENCPIALALFDEFDYIKGVFDLYIYYKHIKHT